MGLGCKSGPKVVPNGSLKNYCKVSNGHVIEHVLIGQNGGSTHITLLNCMQDDLLIKYEVYQIAHEMWQALKKKVWWTFSYKDERTSNEI